NEEPITYFAMMVLRDDLLDVHKRWYLTMGDSDVY
ncbi:unnamed protein product, partial [marine sediment metagenome]